MTSGGVAVPVGVVWGVSVTCVTGDAWYQLGDEGVGKRIRGEDG